MGAEQSAWSKTGVLLVRLICTSVCIPCTISHNGELGHMYRQGLDYLCVDDLSADDLFV